MASVPSMLLALTAIILTLQPGSCTIRILNCVIKEVQQPPWCNDYIYFIAQYYISKLNSSYSDLSILR